MFTFERDQKGTAIWTFASVSRSQWPTRTEKYVVAPLRGERVFRKREFLVSCVFVRACVTATRAGVLRAGVVNLSLSYKCDMASQYYRVEIAPFFFLFISEMLRHC